MPHLTLIETFLAVLVAIFALPYLVWRLGRTEYVAPLVVVQILAGILLGPGVLGAALPALHAALFPPDVITMLNGIAMWGVMLFVFVAGLELDLKAAWRWRGETGVTAGLAFGTPMLLGAGAGGLVLALDGRAAWVGAEGQDWQFIAGVGMACAVTALPILVLFLEKLAMLRDTLGQRVLRYASLDDIAIWAVLALILLDWERVGRQAAFIALLVPAVLLVRWAMARLPQRDRWYVALVWLALLGLAADWSGLHFMVGAFIAGAVLDGEWFGQERVDRFRDTVLLALMPVFFLSTGLKTQWSAGGWTVAGFAALLLAASVAGKLGGVALAGRFLRWRQGEAWLIGWLLQTKALIMIIFANVLLDKQIITPASFTALLLCAVASTMLTVPFATPALRRLRASDGAT
ncbi:cation:proton antiporter [Erythrobacter arachoides]|uniref:Cation:proton antiporter n=1 Tax=Aurantiacibacter arachoides TaxID=1850444 RepID=A0A844ZZP9_9SPHN|nr:cation:proton antiporter [Aurantiacibacter arachoides]MXO92702.1 cation:proton antiporter [Aurantiacibacter arachoides]